MGLALCTAGALRGGCTCFDLIQLRGQCGLVHHATILEFNVPRYRTEQARSRRRSEAGAEPLDLPPPAPPDHREYF